MAIAAERLREVGRSTSRWLDVGGSLLHVRVPANDSGDAARPPLVLLHGSSVSSRRLVPLALRLAPRFRVLAPDLPGFGRSPAAGCPPEIGALAAAFGAFLEAAGLERASVLAHSAGAQVVSALPERDAARIERAVLVSPTLDPRRRPLPRLAAGALAMADDEPLSVVPLMALDFVQAGLLRTVRTFAASARDRPEERFPRLRCPTLVVRGGRDAFVSRAWAERVVELLPDARLAEVPGAHMVVYSEPDAVARVAAAFLGEGAERVAEATSRAVA